MDELILGTIIFAGYSLGFGITKAASRGKFPRAGFLEHNEYTITICGIAVFSLILYAVLRETAIFYVAGIIIAMNLVVYVFDRLILSRFNLSNAGFLGLFVLALIIFYTIAAIVN